MVIIRLPKIKHSIIEPQNAAAYSVTCDLLAKSTHIQLLTVLVEDTYSFGGPMKYLCRMELPFGGRVKYTCVMEFRRMEKTATDDRGASGSSSENWFTFTLLTLLPVAVDKNIGSCRLFLIWQADVYPTKPQVVVY